MKRQLITFTALLTLAAGFAQLQDMMSPTVFQFLEEQSMNSGLLTNQGADATELLKSRFAPTRIINGIEMADVFIDYESTQVIPLLKANGVRVNCVFDDFLTAQAPVNHLKAICKIDASVAPPLQKKLDTYTPLRRKCHVLMFGNSYTNDQQYYSSLLLNTYGVDPNNASLSRIEIGAYMLQDWARCVDDTSSISYYGQNANPIPSTSAVFNVKTAFGTGYATSGTLTELLSEPWDIICFQQRSNGSADYTTIGHYLNVLISKVREVCSNPDVKIYYDMTQGMPNNNLITYDKIISTMNQLMNDFGDEIYSIIPVGTAIENLRRSELNSGNMNEFTRDGSHLANGAGKYVAGLTLAMTLFREMMATTLFEDTSTTIKLSETSGTGELAVDESNRALLQQCVYNALMNPFNANEPIAITGDVNGDRIVNIADVTTLIDYLLDETVPPQNYIPFNYMNADVNKDQAIDIADVTSLIDNLLAD